MIKAIKKGFTLVELVIVIAVIAILSAVLLPTFAGILERARENARMQRATSARDEFFSTFNFASISEMENYIISIDDNLYKIESNGKISKLSGDISNYTDYQEHTSFSGIDATIYSPKIAENIAGLIEYYDENNNLIVENWDTLVASGDIVVTNSEYGLQFNSISSSLKDTIKTIIVPSSIKSIETYGLRYLQNLEHIEIPASVEHFNGGNFYYCNNLKTIKVSPNNKRFTSRNSNGDECNVVIDREYEYFDSSILELYTCSALIIGCNYSTIPDNVKVIAFNSFIGHNNIGDITIPEGVEVVAFQAFWDTGNIKSLSIPSTLRYIEDGAFGTAITDMESITVSNNNPIFTDNDSNCIYNKNTKELVLACKNTVLPDDVEIIGSFAYYSVQGITSLTLPNTVKTLKDNCFAYSSLESLFIPKSVTSLTKSSLSSMYYCTISFDENSQFKIENNCIIDTTNNKLITSLKSTSISDGVEQIGEYAFYADTPYPYITYIEIPDSVKLIESYAFYYYGELSIFVISNTDLVINWGSFCSSNTVIYFKGTAEDLEGTTLGNGLIENNYTNIKYYNDNMLNTDENLDLYWFYLDNVPTLWSEFYSE